MTYNARRVEYAARLRGDILKNLKTNCVGALIRRSAQKYRKAVNVSRDTDTGIELKSLILAQIERWRHA